MSTRKLQAGLSLIELLVGLVIGLLAIIVIGQVTAAFEGQKRTSTGGADAQSNGGAALRELNGAIGMAGLGLINPGMPYDAANPFLNSGNQFCPLGVNIFYNGNVVSNPGVLAAPPASDGGILAPVRIINGATATGDSIIVARSDSEFGVLAATIATAPVNPPAMPWTVTVNSALGFQVGQLVLIGAADGSKVCSLLQISAITATPPGPPATSSQNLQFATGSGSPYNPANPNATFASFGALKSTYAANDVVINMGTSTLGGNLATDRSFVYRRYEVQCGKLVVVDPSQTAGPYTCNNTVPITDEIVSVQAQYGISLASSQAVDHWVDGTGAWAYNVLTAAQINHIKAVRIAVVSRSPQLEKTNVSPTTLTLWSKLKPADDNPPIFAVPDQHYRYIVHTTVIPLKNVLWGALP